MALRFDLLAIDNIPGSPPEVLSTRMLLVRRPIHGGF